MTGSLPKRKLNRKRNYNYSLPGFYFITICTKGMLHHFGRIENEKMVLNEKGIITAAFWEEIPNHYISLELDEWIIMPNHIHGIIGINHSPGRKKEEKVLMKIRGYIRENPIRW